MVRHYLNFTLTSTLILTLVLTLIRCDVTDPKSRNETCNGRGDCVNDQCACDLPYLGFNCSESIGCNYWDDDTRAWSSEGCTSKGVIEVNGCANPALGVEDPITGVVERRLTEASSGDVLLPSPPPPSPPFPLFPSAAVPIVDPNVACAYALRCECTHLVRVRVRVRVRVGVRV